MGRNLETLLKGKKTSAQLSHEQEEAERQELRRLFSEDKLVSCYSRLELPSSQFVYLRVYMGGEERRAGTETENSDSWNRAEIKA